MKYSDGLTLVIPTYNRKNQLLNTLKSLELLNDAKIIISDNHSNYSIENEILPFLPGVFRQRISVFHRKYNIGGDLNIAGAFQLCETKWLWILGDDDKLNPSKINDVYKYIEEFKNSNVIWLTICDNINENIQMKSVQELIDVLGNNKNNGDFIFCSNKIFNLPKIQKYIEPIFPKAYTCITQCIPIILSLINGELVQIVTHSNIVQHGGFQGGITWNFENVILGMRTLMDSEFGLQRDIHYQLVGQIVFKYEDIILYLYHNPEKSIDYHYFFNTVYNDLYKYTLHGPNKLLCWLLFRMASYNKSRKLLKLLLSSVRKIKKIHSHNNS